MAKKEAKVSVTYRPMNFTIRFSAGKYTCVHQNASAAHAVCCLLGPERPFAGLKAAVVSLMYLLRYRYR
jgi:hypothetical protein